MNEKFSVLMSVYKNESVSNFKAAMQSVLHQTVKPDEIILVRDGEVSPLLQNSIDTFLLEHHSLFTYIPLDKNSGLGNALSIGLQSSRNELIARMDTDDICVPNRFELQLKMFIDHPELDVVGGQVVEFEGDVDNIIGKRTVPTSHNDIVSFLKKRNPFNHPSVMFKKSSVLNVGNYVEMRFVEDYYLWCKMFLAGCTFRNLPEVIVKMRVNSERHQRRGGYLYFKTLKQLEEIKKDYEIISRSRYIINVFFRFFQCVLIPNNLRGILYQKLFRHNHAENYRYEL